MALNIIFNAVGADANFVFSYKACSPSWLLKVNKAVNQPFHGLEILFQGFAAQILNIIFPWFFLYTRNLRGFLFVLIYRRIGQFRTR